MFARQKYDQKGMVEQVLRASVRCIALMVISVQGCESKNHYSGNTISPSRKSSGQQSTDADANATVKGSTSANSTQPQVVANPENSSHSVTNTASPNSSGSTSSTPPVAGTVTPSTGIQTPAPTMQLTAVPTSSSQNSTSSCIERPVIGAIQPQEKWAWKDPSYPVTFSSPVAGDIDKDGDVEIISIGSTQAYQSTSGRLSVISGKTGVLKWYASGVQPLSSTTPAIADLDGDGWAEILTMELSAQSSINVVIVDTKTQTVRKRTPISGCRDFCMLAVADLDGDGSAEIVAGDSILTSSGIKKATLAEASKFIPTVADLIPDRLGLEIIVNGNTVLDSNGSKLWTAACAVGSAQPFSAVADLNRDGKPEHICVGLGKLQVFSNDNKFMWSQPLPANGTGNNSGGAPNVGDFNGDGLFEIGVAGGYFYSVFSSQGQMLWSKPVKDVSSASTGSTIFDFNGDGRVEVIYNDEEKLRIYDGSSGNILWEIANASATQWEYPLIVDIDESSSAEIVVSSPTQGGVRAFFDPSNQWVTSRRVWNQYSYYPEIVSDVLAAVRLPGIPRSGFRINTQGSARSECVK